MVTAPPYLTEAEIAEICEPLTQAHAQLRYLQGLGIPVSRKPGGRPLVGRAAFERAIAGTPAAAANESVSDPGSQPDFSALEQHLKKRKHGTQAQIC